MADLLKALQKEDTQATKVSDDNNTEKCTLSSQLPMTMGVLPFFRCVCIMYIHACMCGMVCIGQVFRKGIHCSALHFVCISCTCTCVYVGIPRSLHKPILYPLPLSPSLSLSQESVSYTCHVSGPGLTSATVNLTTQVLVELTDSSGRPHPLPMNVTAQLEPVSKATPTNQQATPSEQATPITLVATPSSSRRPRFRKSPSRYEVTYTPVSRGRHKLHVQVNDKEINGSPFTVTVYPDPKQLGHPVRTVTGLVTPYDIAFNNREEMIVSECGADRLSILDTRGQKIRTFGSHGDSPHQMIHPVGVATDDSSNICVSSLHKLQKFTSTGELINCVGRKGGKEGEFDDPRGLTLCDNLVYVCDGNNHRIQVFDLDLNFVRSIGSRGSGRGEFDEPSDVKFDIAGKMYVAEYGNRRLQVMDSSGRFIREFGRGKLSGPSCLLIADKYVYVSDVSGNCIVVYETSGQYVTSFGEYGGNEGAFDGPYCITSCVNGFIHVCDCANNRVQIF